jgi:hypothetical protein
MEASSRSPDFIAPSPLDQFSHGFWGANLARESAAAGGVAESPTERRYARRKAAWASRVRREGEVDLLVALA